jgi:hypothetical protein
LKELDKNYKFTLLILFSLFYFTFIITPFPASYLNSEQGSAPDLQAKISMLVSALEISSVAWIHSPTLTVVGGFKPPINLTRSS